MLISCLRGDLPSASLKSFFTDATGGYPGGVWYSTFLYVTARPATEAPVTALYLRGRRCTAAPMRQNDQQRTYRNLCCTWQDVYVPVWHTTDGDVALLTEQARGGVRQV